MMTTQEIMELAMEMSQLEVEPADSGIYVEGQASKTSFLVLILAWKNCCGQDNRVLIWS